jgi:hypothetical protein
MFSTQLHKFVYERYNWNTARKLVVAYVGVGEFNQMSIQRTNGSAYMELSHVNKK